MTFSYYDRGVGCKLYNNTWRGVEWAVLGFANNVRATLAEVSFVPQYDGVARSLHYIFSSPQFRAIKLTHH